MNEYIIIGRLEEDKVSGPGEVVKSLLVGLQQKKIKYQFINVYSRNKVKMLLKILMIFFKKNVVVNIHSFGYTLPYIVLQISKLNKKNKYFLTLHGIYSHEAQINGIEMEPKTIKMEKSIITEFPNIICVSEYMMKYVKKNYDTKNNVIFINNGISKVNKEKYSHKSNIYLYVGGFNRRKNPLFTIELFSQILTIDDSAKLYICGGTDDAELFQFAAQTIKKYKIEDSVVILGKISKEKLFELYSISKYILAPSEFDTFNMAVLEAMNYGCVPIISQNCGIKDLVVDSGIVSINIKQIIETLKKISSKRYLELSNQNYEISLNNTYKEMTEEFLRVTNI